MHDSIITGDFTEIHLAQKPSHPIALAHQAMVDELARIAVPTISINPSGDQFDDVNDYIGRVARLMDRWLKDVGAEVASNSYTPLEKDAFADRFFNAYYDFSQGEIDKAATAAREQEAEYRVAYRHRRTMKALIGDIQAER